MESFFAGSLLTVVASLEGAKIWAQPAVVEIIKSAVVAALERSLLGTRCGMPRNRTFGKRFFSTFKTRHGRKSLQRLDDNARSERGQFRSVEDRGLIESSPWGCQ